MTFGYPRKSTDLENTYEDFIVELDNEYNHIQVYFTDLSTYSKDKKEAIRNEFLEEDYEAKHSLSKQPNYSLYGKKFDDLLAKSIVVTLISNFEFSLINLIELLIKEGYIKNKKFQKPKNRIIYNCLDFLSKNTPILKEDLYYETFEIFIKLRNSIVHENSKINDAIINNINYHLYSDFIVVENEYFYFNDVLINYHLTKILRTFFNSMARNIK